MKPQISRHLPGGGHVVPVACGLRRAAAVARGQRGGAYVGVLLTIAVLAIVYGAAAPNLSETYAVYTLHGAAQRAVADLQMARIAATTENNRYRFALANAHTYVVHDDDDNDAVVDAGERVTTVDLARETPGVNIAVAGAVTFVPDGTAQAGRTVTLTGRNGTRTVTVSPAGQVQLQ